jgi:hypothetical protein
LDKPVNAISRRNNNVVAGCIASLESGRMVSEYITPEEQDLLTIAEVYFEVPRLFAETCI